jgi:membrane protein
MVPRPGGAELDLGAAGALIVLMFWVYYSAQIFLFGAELTKAIVDARNPAPRRKREEPFTSA